jgi:predicted flap endonuclease-1-like 5' DNA nuclease
VTGFALLAFVALAIGVGVAYRAGAISARRGVRLAAIEDAARDAQVSVREHPTAGEERSSLPETLAGLPQLLDFAEERRKLFAELADARGETARYRQIVVDIERDAPPPLLDAPGTPDDLKLIVGVGPVIERMLYQLGIGTYRQIARWSDRDIDAIDARLPEFPGRIRRDAWVTQARALHLSKYGSAP